MTSDRRISSNYWKRGKDARWEASPTGKLERGDRRVSWPTGEKLISELGSFAVMHGKHVKKHPAGVAVLVAVA